MATSNRYGFVAYIDESGDDGIRRVFPLYANGSSEWLVLGAVVVQTSNENAVGRWHKDILDKCRMAQRRDLHYRELSDDRKIITCHEIACAPLRCFVVMSNKKNIQGYRNPNTAPEANWLYWWMTRLLLERVTKFCARKSLHLYRRPLPIKMVFSQRGGMDYERLQKYLELLRFETKIGHVHLKGGNLSWPMVDTKNLLYVMSHKNEVGLQLADAVAGAFYEAVSMERGRGCCADFAKLLLPRLYRERGGSILGAGLKPMPWPNRMRLLVPQREIFEAAGFQPELW